MTFKDVELKEKELYKMFEELKEVFNSELMSTENPNGVITVSNNISIVNSKSLGASWEPIYYNSKLQAKEVIGYLNSCETISSFRTKLNELLTKKKFVYKQNTIYLNEPIIEKLKLLNK